MKILLLIVFSIAIFFVTSWWVMALFAAVAVTAAVMARIPFARLAIPLIPVLLLALFAVVFAYASSPNLAGLLDGLLVAVRMVTLVAASLVVCYTSRGTELIRAFAWFLEPLRFLHLPIDDIAYTLSLALRFIPVIAGELALVRMAQRARGGNLHNLGFLRRLRVWGAAFSAVFVGLFRHADSLASAMDARCYGACHRRTSLHDSH